MAFGEIRFLSPIFSAGCCREPRASSRGGRLYHTSVEVRIGAELRGARRPPVLLGELAERSRPVHGPTMGGTKGLSPRLPRSLGRRGCDGGSRGRARGFDVVTSRSTSR